MGVVGAWVSELEDALSVKVHSKVPVAGGDINEGYDVELSSGQRVFVKTNRHTPPRMFELEAAGLEFLRGGLGHDSPLVIPEVVHIAPTFLVLEFLHRSHNDYSEAFGIGLAHLHGAPADMFGAPRPNFIGSLGQVNDPCASWVDFYRERRLEAQLALPGAQRFVSRELRRRFELLYRALSDLLGDEEPPARLHGDLWGGNSFPTSRGPALFDPAAYGGHREVDLAMMRLFGGFSERTFHSYQEAFPLAPGSSERFKIYQLYPLLVHVNLFGSSYVGQLEDTLRSVT